MKKTKIQLIPMLSVMKESIKNPRLSYADIESKISSTYEDFLDHSFSINDNFNLIINSTGRDGKNMLAKEKIIYSMLIIPQLQNAVHLWAYGRPSLGKSYLFKNVFSSTSTSISGNITIPQLCGSLRENKAESILFTFKSLAFEDIQSFPLTTEIVGKLLDILSTGNISRSEKESKVTDSSIIFIGNYRDDIESKLQENPYDNLQESVSTSFNEKLNTEAFKSRVSIVPLWLCRTLPLIKDSSSFGVKIDFLLDKFSELRSQVPLVNDFSNLSMERLKNNARSLTNGFYKIGYFSSLVDGDTNFSPLDIEAFNFISEKIAMLPFSNKKLVLTGNEAINQLWIKLSQDFMPYPITSITEAYVDENRVTLRFKEEPEVLYKIAIDPKGIEYNAKEVEIFSEADEFLKEELVPVVSIRNDNIVIKAITKSSVLSSYQKINHIDSLIGDHMNIEELKASCTDQNFIKMFDFLMERLTKETSVLKNELNEIKKYNHKILMECTTKEQRLAIGFYKPSKEEYEELINEEIEIIQKMTSTHKELFKNYYFTFDKNSKRSTLLHYFFLRNENLSFQNISELSDRVGAL
ncbi:BREX system Lon protease-like protein BrxL [Fusobacterium sp.]|uniref:BREX system Lon protease-like protein BrxL n=1 Tax=Fusobacterium sp. TaxID=68766 RepID=UPI0029048F96|nr:BREX system Lon protease-like protein BrxL [Fusobacterium sp.]MDU1911922.1 BREX system Lon protease-like protein BrxL [Fusobacterium sp.]